MNKIRFVLFVVLAVFCIDSFAQVLIGPVVGGHIGWTTFQDKSNKDIYKIKPDFGLNVGASISFRVQKRFFLQTSILYSRKGKVMEEKNNRPFYDADFSNDVIYNYLEMPILYTAEFKGKLGNKSNKEFKWYLGVGPTISYWLGGKGVLSDGDLVEANVNSLPYKITFGKAREDVKEGEMNVQDGNRIQLGLNMSSGLILEPIGLNKIMIALRYEFGHSLLSLDSEGHFGGYDNDLYYEDDLQVRIQTLNLSFHYFIDLKTDQRKKGKSTLKFKRSGLRRR